MTRLRAAALICAGLAIAAFVVAEVEAQKTKGKTRAISTKNLMKGLIGPACGDLNKALTAAEVNWDDVVLKASLLNESGYILMDDGRCPDGEWARASKALQAQSATILAKAEAKDLDGAKAAFADFTANTCKVCHTAHKGK